MEESDPVPASAGRAVSPLENGTGFPADSQGIYSGGLSAGVFFVRKKTPAKPAGQTLYS